MTTAPLVGNLLLVAFAVGVQFAVVPMTLGILLASVLLLVDQRDDHTLSALRVTPLTLQSYLAYRVVVPVILSVVMTFVAVRVAGLIEVEVAALALVSICAALLAPLYAVFLAAFAKNKVQAFALVKGSGALIWATLFAYFVASRWQLAFAIVPHYWAAKLLWVLYSGEPYAWIYASVGVVYQMALLALLMQRFKGGLAAAG